MNFGKIFLTLLNILDFISGFLAAPYIAFLVLNSFLPVRENRWAKPLLYGGCFFFAAQSIYVGDPVNILGVLLVFSFAVFLCCGGTFLQRLSILLIFSSLNLSFSALIDNFLWVDINALLSIGSFMRWGILRLAVWLAVYLALGRSAPKREYGLPPRLWMLVDMLALTPFAATLITVIMGDGEKTAGNIRDMLLLPVVTLTSFGLLFAVSVLAEQQKLEQEKNYYEMNRLYYRNLEQEQLQVRRLRHDMANHLQTISALPEPELREYISELLHSPAMEHTRRFCENNVVNIVMASKEAVMAQNGIRTEIEASVPKELPVPDADLCALFANSLDNAIEACRKLPEERRKISVRARADRGLFVLRVRNFSGEKAVWKNGAPVTGKQNAEAHGFGLAGIREIAARHGGSTEITETEGQFTLLVFFPLNGPKG